MAIEQVIVLGAGASKSEGAPLQRDLIKKFFEFVNSSHNDELNDFSESLSELDAFFSEFWGISIRNHPINSNIFPTFEECLGVLDNAKIRNETFRGYEKGRLASFRNSLIFLIAKILDETLKNSGIYHRQLIDRLVQENNLLKTTFVSLNYDILIDNALLKIYDRCHLDYGIDLANYYRPYNFKKPLPEKAVSLLKLHGSLNWLYCPACIQITRTPQKATEAFYRAEYCEKCQTVMEPVIIPPTLLKELSNIFIREIMLKTVSVFKEAKRFIFCGYSFPDADMHIKYMLKQAEIYRVEERNVYICNGNTSEEELMRYKRFFRGKNLVKDTGMTFEEFCENGIQEA
jgi:hypothetical protein